MDDYKTLSPAARAVRLAAINAEPGQTISAALRAAVDQVVPEENVDEADYDCLHAKWAAEGEQKVRGQLLSIATELENIQ